MFYRDRVVTARLQPCHELCARGAGRVVVDKDTQNALRLRAFVGKGAVANIEHRVVLESTGNVGLIPGVGGSDTDAVLVRGRACNGGGRGLFARVAHGSHDQGLWIEVHKGVHICSI